MEERVQVWLSRAGFGSRRVCESLIREGRVTQGSRVVQLGDKVADPATLRVDGQPVRVASKEVHFVLHKPRGYVSTMSDPEGRPTVADLLPRTEGRLFPVGRLDFGSEGLMVVTSDGKLAQTLMHPKHGVDKEYAVKLKEPLDDRQIQRELALIKVKGSGEKRVEAMRMSDVFRARVVDTTLESFVFELTGPPEKIDAFIALMRPLGLADVARTGVAAIARGV